MRRGNCGACRVQRIEFAAGESPAGVQGATGYCFLVNKRASNQMISQSRSGAANLTVGDAEPQQCGVKRGGMGSDSLRANFRGERARFPERTGRIAREDFVDGETRVVQRHGQKGCQAAGADNRDGGLSSRHAFGNRFSAQRRSIPYIVVMAKSAGTKSASTKSSQARVLSSRVSYRGPVFSVTTDEVEEPGGVRARRDVIRHAGSIVVLAVDDLASDGRAKRSREAEPRILLERQYRHAAQSMMWELPAGRIDDGETALTAAKRELLEETGYRARHWKRILHFYVSPGFLDETMTIYLARGLQTGEAQPEPDERIATKFFALSEAKQMALNGRIRDAKTISGILWLAQMERPAR